MAKLHSVFVLLTRVSSLDVHRLIISRIRIVRFYVVLNSLEGNLISKNWMCGFVIINESDLVFFETYYNY